MVALHVGRPWAWGLGGSERSGIYPIHRRITRRLITNVQVPRYSSQPRFGATE
jgi:hypothetical protein